MYSRAGPQPTRRWFESLGVVGERSRGKGKVGMVRWWDGGIRAGEREAVGLNIMEKREKDV